MNFLNKYFVYVSTIAGAVFGYVILHPFMHIVIEFFHGHEERVMHLHWDRILPTFMKSFDLVYGPHQLSYVILSGIIGCLFGKSIRAYRRINEQLEKFSKIGMNASSIIHDLNNPLTGVLGFAQWLKRKIENPKQAEICERIEKEATRISKMIMDIKTLAQSPETIELSKIPTDLKPFLENIISKVDLHFEVRIESSFEGKVSIDSDYFERALWNLIKNADEALTATKDGRIEIAINEVDKYVTIRISDNGPGIPKKMLKSVFEFGQTFGKKGGSGIGLANCKKIVEAHGGKIWIISEVDKGTSIYVKIPK